MGKSVNKMLDMKWIKKNIFLGLVLGLLTGFLNQGDTMAEEPLLKLHFVPFAIETYVPITRDNIEKHGHVIWFMEKHAFVQKLLKVLQSHQTKQKILSDGIRLKADFGPAGGVFFVDRDGTVYHETKRVTFRLPKKEMERLENEIMYFVGVVDVKASKRIDKPK